MKLIGQRILEAIEKIPLIDPHTHINPLIPASSNLADLLGYHYYTELAHSSGMRKSRIESPGGLSPRSLVGRLFTEGLPSVSNTVQYDWFLDICRLFFGWEDFEVSSNNWESLYDEAEKIMSNANWAEEVLRKSNVEALFLTNNFDDDLVGFNKDVYIPCLRADELVFQLRAPGVRERLISSSSMNLTGSLASLREVLEERVKHFITAGCRACAISLPPDFAPEFIPFEQATQAWESALQSHQAFATSKDRSLSYWVFWTLSELCDQYELPFDLMVGVNRDVYRDGVHQGRDLFDSRMSLIQYAELFNSFPNVKFPVSVLASVTNQELVSYSWIFPNVITNGHWWYSNTPNFISFDLSSRLQSIPRNKQIGYYSDAYKLEFIAPKFSMYRKILASTLAEDFVVTRKWPEEKAIQLGFEVIRGNISSVFPNRSKV
jgi:glucuronate isomerase